MFFFSLWTWYGVCLMTIYLLLVCFGFAKRKTHQTKSGKDKDSAVLERHETSEKGRSLDQRSGKHATKDDQGCEHVASPRARSREDTSGLRQRFQGEASSEDVVVEEVAEAVQCIPDLESQNFDLEAIQSATKDDEGCEHVASPRARSREDTSGLRQRFQGEASSEDVVVEEVVEAVQCIPGLQRQNFDLEASQSAEKTAELSTATAVVERFSSQQAAKIIENGLQLLSVQFTPVESKESNLESSRSDCKLEREEKETSMRAISAFAGELVKNTVEDVFQHFNVATPDEFARNLSSHVFLEAFAEIREGGVSETCTEHKDKCRPAEQFNSFTHMDGDNVSTNPNIQIFAQDFSEKILNEGVDAVVIKEADTAKVKKYSENFVSHVITDGVLAAGRTLGAERNKPSSSPIGPISEHAQHLTDQLCQMAYQEVALSTSLQASVTGVVENLVNGAISEAVSKVKETSASTEKGAVKKLGAELLKGDSELYSQSENEQDVNVAAAIAEGVVTKAMNEVALLSHSESENAVKTADKVFNGLTKVSEATVNGVQTDESVLRRSPNRSKHTEEVENGSDNKRSGFWRQSLLLDLEEDVDYDDNSSEASCEKALDDLKQGGALASDHDSSEEDSDEFIDSSEDEIIDHAEEAKLGAVGGSQGPVPYVASKWEDHEDDFDDMETFEPEMTVDGLCMSRPHKHKKKSLPRTRVQSAGSHFNQAVVLDNGSGIIKLGLAGERKPAVIQPAIVGTPQRYSLQLTAMDHKKHLKYGDVAMAAAGVMHLDYPMSAGMIDNWTDIEDLWEYLLYDNLGIEEASHPVLVTEVADNHKKNREKIGEILFEHLSVPAMYLVNQLSLSLYASGLTTGVCLSSGFSVTQAAVIYEGYTLKHSIHQLDIAGQGLTDNMKLLLRDNKGYSFPSSSGWQIVNSIKERLAYVSKDFAAEMKQYKTNAGLTKHYKLPDGQMVDVHSEQIQSVEPLFVPSTLMSANDTVASQSPIHKLVQNAIRRCDPEVQEMCFRNIVLSGGSTTLQGLVPRLENELAQINPKIRKVRAPDNRHLSSWIGGSILASLSTFDSMYVTVDEYADSGPRIVNQKCF